MASRLMKVAGSQKQTASTEDNAMRRTVGNASPEKWRCTYEARHLATGYLGAGDPSESNWKGALVVRACDS